MDPNQTTPPFIPSQGSETPVAPQLPTLPEKLLPTPHHTSWGAFIGIIIILIVLIVGALYFWGAKLAERETRNAKPINAGLEVNTEVIP